MAPCKPWGSPRNQIPVPGPSIAIQNQPCVIDEKETRSIRELVKAIDSHTEPIDLEATNNPNVEDQLSGNVQPPLDTQQTLEDATQFQFADLSS